MVKIDFLLEHPETIPTLSQWFRSQWSEYYAKRTLKDIAQDFYAEENRECLPARLVAFMSGELVGTIALREHAIRDLPEYCPGLGGLLVARQYRGRGIGTELVRAGMNLARQQSYERVYAISVAAGGILKRLGWRQVRSILHGEEKLLLYSLILEKVSFPQ
jgi:predicted N-acetyltransferase YhbS